jgi:hypothetical protein
MTLIPRVFPCENRFCQQMRSSSVMHRRAASRHLLRIQRALALKDIDGHIAEIK